MSTRQAEQNVSFPLDYYLYHEAVGIVVVAVPKVGCSTVKRWFMRHTGADPGMDAHKYAYEHLALARHTPERAKHILESRRVLMPVRDPAERLRSAFVDKFVWPKADDLFEPARDIIEDLHRARGIDVTHDTVHVASFGDAAVPISISSAVDYASRPSFRQFAEYIASAEPDHLDAHWRPQASFVAGNRIDVLVPLERLSAALERISSSIGAGSVSLEPENVTRKEPASRGMLADIPAQVLHAQDLYPLVDELVDDNLLKVIRDSHRDDLLLLERAGIQSGAIGNTR